MATGGLYGQSPTGALIAQPGTETTGLYGKSPNGSVIAQPGTESNGLYGNGTTFGGSYFEWFIFQEAVSQPATPTGGSWSFSTNTGTPPSGWSLLPPSAPTNQIWVSIALVNSKSDAGLVWTAPGLFGVVPNITVGTTTTGAAGTDASVINTGTTIDPVLQFTIPRGNTGDTGPTGPQGPKGDTGTAATIAAGTTTTGAAGTSATVTNSGTSSAAVFDFTIPRGDTGATGPTGPTGATGAGVPTGGTAGQILSKVSSTDYDTAWSTLTGTLSYQGAWNASTNTPTLTSSVGTNGYYYVVTVAGTTNLNGITDWQVGDWAIFNGSVWQKIDQTNTVSSVNGYTGAVVLTPSIIGALSGVTSSDGSLTVSQVGTVVDLVVSAASPASTLLLQVKNNTGSTLTKGTVVYINGAVGQLPTVAKAQANAESTSAQTQGLITADIANGGTGYVTIVGLITDFDTSAFSDGEQLYLSGSVAGGMTATKPYAPTHLVYVGVVVYSHAIHGKIQVKVQNGYELDELHNVSAQTPTNGQTIVYNSSNSLWENNTVSLTSGVNGTLPIANGGTGATTASAALTSLGAYPASNPSGYTSNTGTVTSVAATAGTGISVSGSPITTSGTLTITNTAPDQTVVLSAGTGISVSGTYPSFTVTNTAPSSGSGVTSVTGTSPVVSSGGTTPAISLDSGYGDTQNPYAAKTANYILAAPNGSSGVPTFRAVVAADIPTLNQNTTGTAANVTGVVAIANGGTGATTIATAQSNLQVDPAGTAVAMAIALG